MVILCLKPLNLDHECAHFEEMQFVFHLICCLIIGNLIENLIDQIVVRVVEYVDQVRLDHLDQLFV